jgi:hypothetical protein
MPTFDWLSDLNPAYRAQELWHSGEYQREGVFHLVYQVRKPFAIACGAGLLAEHIRRFRFSPDIITRMGQVRDESKRSVFSESFLNHLQRLRLRVQVSMPAEGTLLLPGEPLAIVEGPVEQVALMESALRLHLWRSSQWATHAAVARWERQDWEEEDTPLAPVWNNNLDGWKIRAEYIGGGSAEDMLSIIKTPTRQPEPNEGLQQMTVPDPVVQVRRAFRGQEAQGDIWLSDTQETQASVSKSSATLFEVRNNCMVDLKFTRFQNLYQPLLVKGHAVLPQPRISYLRQRTLKQLEAFGNGKIEQYPRGYWHSV